MGGGEAGGSTGELSKGAEGRTVRRGGVGFAAVQVRVVFAVYPARLLFVGVVRRGIAYERPCLTDCVGGTGPAPTGHPTVDQAVTATMLVGSRAPVGGPPGEGQRPTPAGAFRRCWELFALVGKQDGILARGQPARVAFFALCTWVHKDH